MAVEEVVVAPEKTPKPVCRKAALIQHPAPKKLLVHIGDITVSFGLLEQMIQRLIVSFINEHQRVGQIITAELSFSNLRALVNSLYREHHGEDQDFAVLLDLMKRAGKLEDTRNKISHSLWLAGDSADTTIRMKTTAKEKRRIQFSFEKLGEDELAKIAYELKSLAGEIQDFWIKLISSGRAINNPFEKMWGSGDE